MGSIKQLHKETGSLSERLMGKQCVQALRLERFSLPALYAGLKARPTRTGGYTNPGTALDVLLLDAVFQVCVAGSGQRGACAITDLILLVSEVIIDRK